jgi:hypothetical protein
MRCDLHDVTHRAGDAVQLCDGQDIPIPKVIEGRHKVLALRDAAHLFGEHLLTSSGFEVPSLGFKTGDL